MSAHADYFTFWVCALVFLGGVAAMVTAVLVGYLRAVLVEMAGIRKEVRRG